MMTSVVETSNPIELAARLRRVVMRLSRRLRREAASGLPQAVDSALGVIARRGPLTPSELARLEEVRRPTATRLLALLECRGLVERMPDSCDRRSYRVAVTPAGRALLRDSRTRRDAYLTQTLGALDPTELALLERALELLERVIAEAR